MQVKKKPRNAAAKKIQKASPKEKRTKKKQNEQPLLKRVIFGEERPDLTELEAGSTTILDILAPTTVDTKRKDYVVVDGVYHTYHHNNLILNMPAENYTLTVSRPTP